jgi:hypothetical protein
VEIQTFNPLPGSKHNMQRFDDHFSTLVNHVRVTCLSGYTLTDAVRRRVNITGLVEDAMITNASEHNWRSVNRRCYKSTSDYQKRDGWPPYPKVCDKTCPTNHVFSADVRNHND